ncbi:MAG: UDP-N-acetylmuramate--L-alanine ligase, partial [Candidatus Omnitrophota bacterium]|nr:UDP-N-acetylmuramate--L-alanine ligase [Candidatus Omnitrophota bacterium]
MRIDKFKRIHFVGIGGIGMSGIAMVLLEMGYKVSGSDLEPNSLTRKIEMLGADVFEGHHASNLSDDTGLVVYSSSISKDNPELREARRRKVPVAHRAEMLGWLFNKRRGIAVTGTHGKTTTTSLISVMLENSGLDPTVIIGGEIAQFDGNAKAGNGQYCVAEADESDGSFLNLDPLYAVLTNIEMEHVDHFKALGDTIFAYRSFINNLKKGGVVFYNLDDQNIKALLRGFQGNRKSFGFSKDADMHPIDVKMNGFDTSFRCVYKGRVLGEVKIKIPGIHNVLNAMAAILVGLELGKKFDDITDSIKDFSGAKRRFQLRMEKDGIMLIEDYAHHPTEIRAVLSACRNWKNRRVIAVFQPHRYTRTKFFSSEFGRCFDGADKLILTDIYAASEKPIRGVSVKNIYDRVKAEGFDDVKIIKKEAIAKFLMKIKKPGDMILILGAGDIKKVTEELRGRLAADSADGGLIKKFKKSFKGKLLTGEGLFHHTSFRIGGRTDVWAQPEDEKNLRRILLFVKTNKIPIFIMGNGTNILARDEGFRGVVLNLGSPFFKKVMIKGTTVHIGAGFGLSKLIRLCCLNGLSGIESLVGIPGSVGGAIYMNAGGYTNPIYKNMGNLVASLRVMDYSGRVKNLKKGALKFDYRRSNLEPYIILSATLKLEKGDRDNLFPSCSRFLKMKREKQALDLPSAGCVFKNPPGAQFTCGQMIDMLGLKGKRAGGAQISERLANFIVNRKGATCKDVLSLIDLVRRKVRE